MRIAPEPFATRPGITDFGSMITGGLALSDHLFPPQYGPTETPNLTMSDLKGVNPEDVPYPIIVAAEREEGEIVRPQDTTNSFSC